MNTLLTDLTMNIIGSIVLALLLTIFTHMVFGLIHQIIDINSTVSIKELWNVLPIVGFIASFTVLMTDSI